MARDPHTATPMRRILHIIPTLDQAGAEKHPGSGWDYWMEWLDNVSPGKTEARTPGDGALKP